MHYSILVSFFIASFSTFLAISLLRPFAISINLVDFPNNRKPHQGVIPLIGGVSMYIGIVVSLLVSSYDLNQYNFFLLASLIIVMVGVLDDHQNISVSLRLLLQVLVAIILVSVESTSIVSVGSLLGSNEIVLNEWAFLFSVLAIIAGMNAVNMLDGIHGLAGSNSFVTIMSVILLSGGNISQQNIFIAILVCSVLPVFLIYNLCIGISKNKRIFMGDAGSMLMGLIIAWLLINLSQGESRVFAPVTALWLFSLPLIEMLTSILRRLFSGKSPFKPDLNHTHHLLIRMGFQHKNTLLLMFITNTVFVLIGILGEIYGVAESFMFFGFLMVFIFYFILSGLILNKLNNS